MLQQIIKKINCPNCSVENEVILWEKVNVDMNPDLKEKLFTEKINNLVCNKCGFVSRIDIPFYYNDAKAKFFIYLVPEFPIDKKEEDLLLANLRSQTLNILDSGYNNRKRIVFEYYNMLEKILIFDAKLDDRVVEGCKILARTQLKLMEGRAAFHKFENDELAFNFFEKEEKEAAKSFSVPKAMYDEIAEIINKKDLESGDNFRIVDVKYAVRMLMN
ncbi:MAG: CpXC domain-containing protein [Firmicutes bacterium]|nr:CpXC domain-containing protein [Bacillota bacterium]